MSGAVGRRGYSHACIIESRDAEARQRKALEIARAAVCEKEDSGPCGVCRQCRLALSGIHPDIIFIDRPLDDKGKQRQEIYVSQVRQMAADAWVVPQEAEKKVYIVREAERMNIQAQNAALKILEEPPQYAVFLLCTDSVEELLPTIRSRCMVLRPEGECIYKDDSLAREYVELASRGNEAAICEFCVGCESLDSERITQLLANVRSILYRVLKSEENNIDMPRKEAARIIELCRRAEDYLRLNVSVKHVLGMLCALTEKRTQH